MDEDRYKSLVTRQINAIARAEMQTRSFHRCFAEIEATGQKLAEPQIAEWLKVHRVKASRKGATWSPKTVGDRLYIDQRLEIEYVYESGRRIIASYREQDLDFRLERLRNWLNLLLPRRAITVDEAVEMMAAYSRERVDLAAASLRQGRTFLEI